MIKTLAVSEVKDGLAGQGADLFPGNAQDFRKFLAQDVANTVKEYKAGKVEFRCEAAGIVHCVVGKMSFEPEKLVDNIQALIKFLHQLKPSSSKGIYMRSLSLTATFSPGIQIVA